jgi:hypothetical protein
MLFLGVVLMDGCSEEKNESGPKAAHVAFEGSTEVAVHCL